MLSSPRTKLVTVTILLTILAGLFLWAGTVEFDPADNNYPDTSDIHENPDQYVGDQVTVGGTVVDTDPLTIESEPAPGKTITFVIEGGAPDVTVGDHLRAFGTLQRDNRVTATNTVHREPWEAIYMYIVSFLAGLCVLARLGNRWTIDTTTWSIVPRTDPLVTITS